MLTITKHVCRGFSCNSYLVREGERCLVIDPGTNSEEILRLLDGRRPEAILLTHGHFDHAKAAIGLREATGAPVLAHRAEAALLRDPQKNASLLFGMGAVSLEADGYLDEGDEVHLGERVFRVLHTPGHSPGGLCFYTQGELFSGDTLFADGCGRCDLFGGDERAMRASLSRLFALPGDTRVRSGHGDECLLSRRIAQTELF